MAHRTPRHPVPDPTPPGEVADDTAEAAGPAADTAGRPSRRGGPSPTRRGLLAATAAAGLGALTGCAGQEAESASGPSPSSSSSRRGGAGAPSAGPSPSRRPARRRPELPRGGRRLSRYRLVGYCGLPGAAALGRLGTGDLGDRLAQIEKTARAYATDREPLPVLELLATVVQGTPGPDGRYRSRTPAATIRRFHRAARRHRALLLLNVQPGRAPVLDEVKALREWLVHPDVGLALDPEWQMGPGEVPGDRYGHTTGGELTRVARYLSGLVADHDLPQKPLVFHQVAESVVRDQSALRPQPGVVVIKSADGIGSPGMKRETWRRLVADLPDGLRTGFKLFYDEDTRGGGPLMTPKDVLALRPRPDYVMYE